MKKYIKPVLCAVIWWVLISVEVSIIGFTPRLATMGVHGFIFNPLGLAVHFIIVISLSALFSYIYFRKRPGTFEDGIKFGLIVAGVGLILDAALTVPLFIKSYSAYFGKWSVWAGYILCVIVFGIFTHWFAKHKFNTV